MHTAPYFAAIGILTVIHALRIIRLRLKYKVPLGHGGNDHLERMIRIFGNNIEYAPLGLILLLVLEFVQAPVWYLHLAGVTLLLGRVLHAIGLGQTRGKSPGRFIGTLLTFLSLLVSSIGLVIFSLTLPR